MHISPKVLFFDTALSILSKKKKEGNTIVQCHGTFDLIHPGHIIHFEEAKALGDILVITITAEEFVNKGPGRPYFNDALRIRSLIELECIDYVILIPHSAAKEAIKCVCPDIYCKGLEYKDHHNDPTGNILDDISTVHECGGKVKYVGKIVYSSTKLLNKNFDPYPDAVKAACKDLSTHFTPTDFRNLIESFSNLKVLVIGDIIFDRYSYVRVQGLTTKNRILSGLYDAEEIQTGGAFAVFRHIKQFTDNVQLLGLIGDDKWANELLSEYISADQDEIIRSSQIQTIVKQRFIEPVTEGKELTKLFSSIHVLKLEL